LSCFRNCVDQIWLAYMPADKNAYVLKSHNIQHRMRSVRNSLQFSKCLSLRSPTKRQIRLIGSRFISFCLNMHVWLQAIHGWNDWEDQQSGDLKLNRMSACKTFLLHLCAPWGVVSLWLQWLQWGMSFSQVVWLADRLLTGLGQPQKNP
jgi:hypothetical protein